MTTRYHGSKISGSEHYSSTETAIRIGWATVLILSAMMHGKAIGVNFFRFFFSSAIFVGQGFVEIRKFCCHGNVM